jgi:hypothetical protein
LLSLPTSRSARISSYSVLQSRTWSIGDTKKWYIFSLLILCNKVFLYRKYKLKLCRITSHDVGAFFETSKQCREAWRVTAAEIKFRTVYPFSLHFIHLCREEWWSFRQMIHQLELSSQMPPIHTAHGGCSRSHESTISGPALPVFT